MSPEVYSIYIQHVACNSNFELLKFSLNCFFPGWKDYTAHIFNGGKKNPKNWVHQFEIILDFLFAFGIHQQVSGLILAQYLTTLLGRIGSFKFEVGLRLKFWEGHSRKLMFFCLIQSKTTLKSPFSLSSSDLLILVLISSMNTVKQVLYYTGKEKLIINHNHFLS